MEDDDDLRREICRILEDEGFQAMEAINGLHALAQLETLARPDLIILDLMMPVMNGWDFHARLKANPRLAHVPVLLLSAYVHDETHTGPKDVEVALQKPIRVEEFLGWVSRLARRLNR
ncbi:MAG: response regulator [Acidobacteria bacterium]|nr:response regulator [Acidobacteriota bacterium]MCA1612046.1 response regulator [Acidobacteriota bacterium]